MIPHWKSGENYTGQNYNSDDYQKVKEEYFDYLAEKCKAEGITVQDFYEEAATSAEKDYLHQLEALGSTADLIKIEPLLTIKENGICKSIPIQLLLIEKLFIMQL